MKGAWREIPKEPQGAFSLHHTCLLPLSLVLWNIAEFTELTSCTQNCSHWTFQEPSLSLSLSHTHTHCLFWPLKQISNTCEHQNRTWDSNDGWTENYAQPQSLSTAGVNPATPAAPSMSFLHTNSMELTVYGTPPRHGACVCNHCLSMAISMCWIHQPLSLARHDLFTLSVNTTLKQICWLKHSPISRMKLNEFATSHLQLIYSTLFLLQFGCFNSPMSIFNRKLLVLMCCEGLAWTQTMWTVLWIALKKLWICLWRGSSILTL
jgi:hypothetical protein